MRTNLLLIIFVCSFFISCNQENEQVIEPLPEAEEVDLTRVYKEDFEKDFKDFWLFEAQDSSRFMIVKDPLNSDNQVLKVNLKLDDYNSGGRRAELRTIHTEPLDYLSKYGFDFMLPDSFFEEVEKPGIIFIHQWHDQADPGFNWSTQNKVTHPPIRLFIDIKEDNKYKLVFGAGLETGNMNEVIYSVWEENLEPNRWYSFSCEVFWHVYNDEAYAIPMLDGKYFYSNNTEEEHRHKILRRNMYNGIGNYFKMGLYMFGKEHDEKYAFFDNFYLESTEISCQ